MIPSTEVDLLIDLHVLSILSAFILSQDQTLKFNGLTGRIKHPTYLFCYLNKLKLRFVSFFDDHPKALI